MGSEMCIRDSSVSSMVCLLTSALCAAQATQLSHTRYWYDLEGVFHTLTLVYVDRSREVVSVSQSRSKPRTHKKNNPRPTLPTPSRPRMGRRFFAISLCRYIAKQASTAPYVVHCPSRHAQRSLSPMNSFYSSAAGPLHEENKYI